MAVRRRADGVAGIAGLASCGSVWADPVCNAKVMARRALEVGAAVALWQSQGKPVVFGTFTMRHHKGQGLGTLWEALSLAWRRVVGGKAWITDKGRYEVIGWCRVVEVTIGRNGWHVHVHVLFFLDSWLSADVLAAWHGAMFGRWSAALQRAGLMAPLSIAQDFRLVTGPADADLAAYFTKAVDQPKAMGLELTQSQSKRARTGNGTDPVWSLLDGIEEGDADALDAWHEWERVSKGKRQIGWSRGLRELLGLVREQSDEEIAAEEVGTKDDDLVLIDAEGWEVLCRQPYLIGVLLDVTEAGGLPALREFLDGLGVSYTVPCEE